MSFFDAKICSKIGVEFAAIDGIQEAANTMDATRYMSEMVEPTIADFEANPVSPRHAFLACVVTFHAIDYLTHPKASAGRRKLFREQSPEFALVERVAHAIKHVQIGHKASAQQELVAGNVIVRPPAVWGEMVFDLSRWDNAVGGITIKDEHEIDLLDVVKGGCRIPSEPN